MEKQCYFPVQPLHPLVLFAGALHSASVVATTMHLEQSKFDRSIADALDVYEKLSHQLTEENLDLALVLCLQCFIPAALSLIVQAIEQRTDGYRLSDEEARLLSMVDDPDSELGRYVREALTGRPTAKKKPGSSFIEPEQHSEIG